MKVTPETRRDHYIWYPRLYIDADELILFILLLLYLSNFIFLIQR
jgi:hypothetical protein